MLILLFICRYKDNSHSGSLTEYDIILVSLFTDEGNPEELPQCSSPLILPCKNKISQWRYLNEEEIGLLDAIVEQIIPADRLSRVEDGQMCQISSISNLTLITGNSRLHIVKGYLRLRKTVIQMNW